MRARLLGALLLLMAGVSVSRADDVIDVHQQWLAHASSAPVVLSSTSSARAVFESTETLPAGCGCETLTVSEKLSQATCAFTGTIEELQPPKGGRQKAVFDVDEIFKGTPKPDMDVFTGTEGAACDLAFKEGEKYLIYAQWQWGWFVTSRCMGSKEIETARGDASALGPSEAMKEKIYIHLRNACMGRLDTACCLASLKSMRANYNLPEPDAGCPAGTKPDRLICAGSYTWCIPVTEKDHRPLAR